MNIHPESLIDGYKTDHRRQYPEGTEIVYSNLTARKSRIEGVNEVVFFGLQFFVKEYLIEAWNKGFFEKPLEEILARYSRRMDNYLGPKAITVEHIKELHQLGYLPIKIKALKEGTKVPIGVPMVTIINTKKRFFWLTNYFESVFSNYIWKGITSATVANLYHKRFRKHAKKTGYDQSFIQWQGHDFSFRGMSGIQDAVLSGAGHLLFFTGTDTIPTIDFLEDYYNANSDFELVGGSVPATEHSVMCLGEKESEIDTFRRLITKVYPTGIVSIVSDTWDFWKVMTEYLPALKEEILSRDGRVVIRPDSGNPVDIICGKLPDYIDFDNVDDDDWVSFSEYIYDNYSSNIINRLVKINNVIYKLGNFKSFVEDYGWENGLSEIISDVKQLERNQLLEKVKLSDVNISEEKGAYELLWDIFGGTVNEKGYKVLNPKVGLIYGDAISLERQDKILNRLEAKGFCASNLVLGIGSYTYEYVTRDTFGMAVKATWGVVNGIPRNIFKDPITDRGFKKSAKGLLSVYKDEKGKLTLKDECTVEEENESLLEVVFCDGVLLRDETLGEIRERIKNY